MKPNIFPCAIERVGEDVSCDRRLVNAFHSPAGTKGGYWFLPNAARRRGAMVSVRFSGLIVTAWATGGGRGRPATMHLFLFFDGLLCFPRSAAFRWTRPGSPPLRGISDRVKVYSFIHRVFDLWRFNRIEIWQRKSETFSLSRRYQSQIRSEIFIIRKNFLLTEPRDIQNSMLHSAVSQTVLADQTLFDGETLQTFVQLQPQSIRTDLSLQQNRSVRTLRSPES
jgi:hypothetical protein